MSEFFANRVLQATSIAWATAQALKFLLEILLRRRLDLRLLTTMGGMPSSHSAAVSALTTAIALREGVGSSVFVLSLVFAAVTMYDAAGGRRGRGTPPPL